MKKPWKFAKLNTLFLSDENSLNNTSCSFSPSDRTLTTIFYSSSFRFSVSLQLFCPFCSHSGAFFLQNFFFFLSSQQTFEFWTRKKFLKKCSLHESILWIAQDCSNWTQSKNGTFVSIPRIFIYTDWLDFTHFVRCCFGFGKNEFPKCEGKLYSFVCWKIVGIREDFLSLISSQLVIFALFRGCWKDLCCLWFSFCLKDRLMHFVGELLVHFYGSFVICYTGYM